jgi:hypothetical protein
VDRLHHAFEHGIEELPRLLGVAVRQQLHRALEVGEEHGDLLALALEGALRGEDLLGEVLRRVGVRRGEASVRINLGTDRVTAFVAESRPCREVTAA